MTDAEREAMMQEIFTAIEEYTSRGDAVDRMMKIIDPAIQRAEQRGYKKGYDDGIQPVSLQTPEVISHEPLKWYRKGLFRAADIVETWADDHKTVQPSFTKLVDYLRKEANK